MTEKQFRDEVLRLVSDQGFHKICIDSISACWRNGVSAQEAAETVINDTLYYNGEFDDQ